MAGVKETDGVVNGVREKLAEKGHRKQSHGPLHFPGWNETILEGFEQRNNRIWLIC